MRGNVRWLVVSVMGLVSAGVGLGACDFDADLATYCGNTGRCPPAGSGNPDAGHNTDAGVEPDGGEKPDGGEEPDGGVMSDAGVQDAGTPTCDGAPLDPAFTCMAAGENDPDRVVVAGGYVLWTERGGGGIRRLTTDAPEGALPYQLEALPGQGHLPLVAAGDRVYFTPRDGAAGALYSRRVDGSGPRMIVSDLPWTYCLAVTETEIIGCITGPDTGPVLALYCPIDACEEPQGFGFISTSDLPSTGHIAAEPSSAGARQVLISTSDEILTNVGAGFGKSDIPGVTGLVIMDPTAFWTTDEGLWRGTLGGPFGLTPEAGPFVIANGAREPVVHGNRIFFISQDSIFSVLADGTQEEVVVADVPGLRRFAVTDTAVYFTVSHSDRPQPNGWVGQMGF